jgi:hypothetical protein
MPCGDSTAFPVDAAGTLGRELVSKKFTKAFVPAVGDLACYANTTFSPDGDTPIPFPKPAFGAGLHDHHDDDEVERLGHVLIAASQDHQDAEQGLKAAPNVGAIPWGRIFAIAYPIASNIIQGIVLALSDNPIPKPGVQSGDSTDANVPADANANDQPSPVNANVPHNTPAEKSKPAQQPKPVQPPKPAPPAVAPKPADHK